MLEEENGISLDEVDKVLSEIENKYSPIKISSGCEDVLENLEVLSKEFDSIGVPCIDISKPLPKVLGEVINSARTLVQIHRKTVSEMKDVNINIQSKNSKSKYLYKILDEYESKINSCEDKKNILQNNIAILEQRLSECHKREQELKNEMESIKRYYIAGNSEYSRCIKKLSEENKRLREKLGSDINIRHSRDEVVLECIKKYKHNEDVYKKTIHKLQQNNEQLLTEIVELKMRDPKDN